MLYHHPISANQREPLIAIARATYTETFVGMGYYDEALVAGYCATSFAPAKITAELADPDQLFFFLSTSSNPKEAGGRIGYLKLVLGKALPHATILEAPVYLERLYLLAAVQGQGYGREALSIAQNVAWAQGGRSLWLTVWEHNTPAIGFYERTGWTQVGTTKFPFVSQGQSYVDTDLLYVLELSES